MVRQAAPRGTGQNAYLVNFKGTNIDAIESECRHPGRKGPGMSSVKAFVRFDQIQALFENRTRALAPVIEVSSHDNGITAMHHAVDPMTNSANLASTIGLEKPEMNR